MNSVLMVGQQQKALRPIFNAFSKHVSSHRGLQVPELPTEAFSCCAIALKGVEGFLFIFGSSLGAYSLLLYQLIATPILHNFYNYDPERKEFLQLFTKYTQCLALLVALLFFIGMRTQCEGDT